MGIYDKYADNPVVDWKKADDEDDGDDALKLTLKYKQ